MGRKTRKPCVCSLGGRLNTCESELEPLWVTVWPAFSEVESGLRQLLGEGSRREASTQKFQTIRYMDASGWGEASTQTHTFVKSQSVVCVSECKHLYVCTCL